MNPITFLIENPKESDYICKHIKEQTYKELSDHWNEMYRMVIEYLKTLDKK